MSGGEWYFKCTDMGKYMWAMTASDHVFYVGTDYSAHVMLPSHIEAIHSIYCTYPLTLTKSLSLVRSVFHKQTHGWELQLSATIFHSLLWWSCVLAHTESASHVFTEKSTFVFKASRHWRETRHSPKGDHSTAPIHLGTHPWMHYQQTCSRSTLSPEKVVKSTIKFPISELQKTFWWFFCGYYLSFRWQVSRNIPSKCWKV